MDQGIKMQTFSAHEAKQNFGTVMDAALRQPVAITKHGRPSVIITSAEEYNEFRQLVREYLKAEVRKGIDDIQAGRFQQFESHADLRKLFAQIKRELGSDENHESSEQR